MPINGNSEHFYSSTKFHQRPRKILYWESTSSTKVVAIQDYAICTCRAIERASEEMNLTLCTYFRIACFLIFVTKATRPVIAHGLVTIPRQRGALRVRNRLVQDIDPNAPFDPAAHFPAGDKNSAPGAGKRSVMRAASNFWTPYEPFSDEFKWRAGVCGDDLYGDQEHVKVNTAFFHFSLAQSTFERNDIDR